MKIGARNNKQKINNAGFTLVEMVIVISIFAILLGIIIPSVGSLTRFRANKTTEELTAALDQTRTEAMSRLAGELCIYQDSEGNYCIQYYLDRGKNSDYVVPSQPEVIAGKNSRVNIKYFIEGDSQAKSIEGDQKLILSYDRDTGGFLPILSNIVTSEEMEEYWAAVEDGQWVDMPVRQNGEKNYCERIVVYRGDTEYKSIHLEKKTGTYTVS